MYVLISASSRCLPRDVTFCQGAGRIRRREDGVRGTRRDMQCLRLWCNVLSCPSLVFARPRRRCASRPFCSYCVSGTISHAPQHYLVSFAQRRWAGVLPRGKRGLFFPSSSVVVEAFGRILVRRYGSARKTAMSFCPKEVGERGHNGRGEEAQKKAGRREERRRLCELSVSFLRLFLETITLPRKPRKKAGERQARADLPKRTETRDIK